MGTATIAEKLVAMFLATIVSNPSNVTTEQMEFLKSREVYDMVSVQELMREPGFDTELCQQYIIEEQEKLEEAYEQEQYLKQLQGEQRTLKCFTK